MAGDNRRGPLLEHLDNIEARCQRGDLTLRELIDIFGSDSHYVLITFLIIPFLQPIPMPGLSSLFGILIAIVAILAFWNKPPWLPKQWLNKSISAKTVLRIAETSERVFEKLTPILHPRQNFLLAGPFRSLNALVIIVNALLLSLPLPIPFSNAFPAWAIAFQALAHLEEDGLFILLSYIQAVLCLIYFGLLLFGAGSGLEFLKAQF